MPGDAGLHLKLTNVVNRVLFNELDESVDTCFVINVELFLEVLRRDRHQVLNKLVAAVPYTRIATAVHVLFVDSKSCLFPQI